MTYFLVQRIREARSSLSLSQAAGELQVLVPDYVRSRFPGSQQIPQFVENTSQPLMLRP